jgi:DnaK suppressor protein
MSETRLIELKQMLETRRRELQQSVGAKLRDVRENSGDDAEMRGRLDAAESSDVDVRHDIDVALLEMKAETLRYVNDALDRLAVGAYGLCTKCGAEISRHRLAAIPFALGCRTCEDEREIGQRQSRRLAERRSGAVGPFDAGLRQ